MRRSDGRTDFHGRWNKQGRRCNCGSKAIPARRVERGIRHFSRKVLDPVAYVSLERQLIITALSHLPLLFVTRSFFILRFYFPLSPSTLSSPLFYRIPHVFSFQITLNLVSRLRTSEFVELRIQRVVLCALCNRYHGYTGMRFF